MNKYTEQHIKKELERLASIEPSQDSLQRMNSDIRRIIDGDGKKTETLHRLFYYALASAAVLMIGIGLLFKTDPTETGIVRQMPAEPTLTLANLNTVFHIGGQQALNDYFDKIEMPLFEKLADQKRAEYIDPEKYQQN